MHVRSGRVRLVVGFGLLGWAALHDIALARDLATSTTPVRSESPSGAAPRQVGATPAAGTVAGCARKVKIVYSGYGEADRGGCGEPATPLVR